MHRDELLGEDHNSNRDHWCSLEGNLKDLRTEKKIVSQFWKYKAVYYIIIYIINYIYNVLKNFF